MSRLLGSLLPAPACWAAFVLVALPALAQPAPTAGMPPQPVDRIVMHLNYNGVPGCSDPEPFILALTPRVHGWDPLSENGRWRLVVSIKRRAPGYEGSAELHDPKGEVMWTRAFPPKRSCAVLLDRLAFAVAFRIDEGGPPPPAPPVPTACVPAPVEAGKPPPVATEPSCAEDMTEIVPPLPVPPSMPTPHEPKTALSFGLGTAAWIGQITTDRAALGFTLDAGIRYGWFSAAIEGRGDPPQAPLPIATGGSANYARATGALLFCGHYGWFVGCAKGEAGRFLLIGNLPESTHGYGAAGLRLGLDFPVVPRRFFLRVAGEVLAAFDPATIRVRHQTLFQVTGTSTGLGLGALFALDKP